MNGEQGQPKNLIDTTDCLEAVGVFRGWKNLLFVVVMFLLLLLQVSFWLVDAGYVKTKQADKPAAMVSEPEQAETATAEIETKEAKEKIEKAAEQVAAPDKPTEAVPQQPQSKPSKARFGIEFKHIAWLIRFVDFVLVPAAILYCLTMLFALKISLVGRLGGINHISRAFFISLLFIVLLLPWQLPWRAFFGKAVVLGAMYTPKELFCWYSSENVGVFGVIFYYLRFTGYWLLVLLLLIFSHIRSTRWAKAILRRLEVI